MNYSMDSRKLAAEYRLSHWAEIIRERGESGLSVKEYCTRAGFSVKTYFVWQRRLRAASAEALAAMEPKQLPTPRGWAAVAEAEPPSPGATLTVEVGGCRVAVNSETDPELLAKVCKVLVSLC